MSLKNILLVGGMLSTLNVNIHGKQEECVKELIQVFQTEKEDYDKIIEFEGKKYELQGEKQIGEVSWYGGKFHGRKTASGEIFDKEKLTAAHKNLPFGTQVLFIDKENNDSIIIKVNDRGPFVKGRVFDLSERAARELGNVLLSGHKKVEYQIVKEIHE